MRLPCTHFQWLRVALHENRLSLNQWPGLSHILFLFTFHISESYTTDSGYWAVVSYFTSIHLPLYTCFLLKIFGTLSLNRRKKKRIDLNRNNIIRTLPVKSFCTAGNVRSKSITEIVITYFGRVFKWFSLNSNILNLTSLGIREKIISSSYEVVQKPIGMGSCSVGCSKASLSTAK